MATIFDPPSEYRGLGGYSSEITVRTIPIGDEDRENMGLVKPPGIGLSGRGGLFTNSPGLSVVTEIIVPATPGAL